MIFELFKDVVKLALIVTCLFYVFGAYVRHYQPAWSQALEKRRLTTLMALVFAASAIKVSEDVLGGESGPIDRLILLYIHGHVSDALTGFFEATSFTGSSKFLFPLVAAVTLGLFWAKHRFEALLVSGSVIVAAVIIYLVKMAVGRVRPKLWETELYWGSSFPSGHTLAVAAFATAITLVVNRIWPKMVMPALLMAIVWTTLVALSRLVLGVHWPTDVLVAACVGAVLPLMMSVIFELRKC
jgi:undecaprenyl-diphosphatase